MIDQRIAIEASRERSVKHVHASLCSERVLGRLVEVERLSSGTVTCLSSNFDRFQLATLPSMKLTDNSPLIISFDSGLQISVCQIAS